ENLEIRHQDAGKGNGLKLMANHFNIQIENTFVLGDSMNDYSMFQVAGTGIAMENAIDELKAISNYITTTNDEHGVAYAIENYILTELKESLRYEIRDSFLNRILLFLT